MFDFLSRKFSGILSWLQDKGRLSEQNITDAMQQVRDALLEADVPLDIVEEFLGQIKNEVVAKNIQTKLNPGHLFIKIVHEKLLNFLGGSSAVAPSFQIPSIIMVMGLQGSGKTTTIGKIARWMQREAQKRGKTRRILCASIDFYRPAAVDQLAVVAGKAGVDFYRAKYSSPIDAAREIQEYFKQHGYEYLLLDTAGRLHIDQGMMDELVAVERKLTPKHKLLVLDAMTGQESLRVAKAFDEHVGFQAAVLTKLDSDARGGAAFAFRYALKKPIAFVGAGEKMDELESFIPERMASRILGMGDILTLIEKAEDSIDTKSQEDMARRLLHGGFTLEDFAQQMAMLDRLGPLQKVMKYIPGMPNVSAEAIESGQAEMKQFAAIISSMTRKERLFPEILDGSRKQRIAAGSGSTAQDVNRLLQRFEQSKQFAKMFKKSGKFKNFLK